MTRNLEKNLKTKQDLICLGCFMLSPINSDSSSRIIARFYSSSDWRCFLAPSLFLCRCIKRGPSRNFTLFSVSAYDWCSQSVSAYDIADIICRRIIESLGFLYGVNYLAVDFFAKANRGWRLLPTAEPTSPRVDVNGPTCQCAQAF